MANMTLIDIAKFNADGLKEVIEESIKVSPEVQLGAARTIEGTSYETLHRTAFPVAGFRNANEGAAVVMGSYKNKLVQTFIMDTPIEMDKAVADASEDGAAAVLSLEAGGVTEAQMRALSSQFYYGTATTIATSAALAPTKGFPGIAQVVSTGNTKDAAGVTGATTSVYGVKFGPTQVQWVLGRDGQISTGDPTIVRLTDGNNNPYDGYRIPFLAYVGLQVVNPNSICRIKNLDAGAPLTDALIFSLLSQLPNGVQPDVWYMTKVALEQLRNSRTATHPTGEPAPTPDSAANIPIVTTDGISAAEAA